MKDWLIGTWETWDEDSRVMYEVSKTARGLSVRAFDKNDGEEYVVSKVRWDGRCLNFEIYVPSTKYRTRNRLKPVSRRKFIQEITFWEPWKKVATPENPRKAKSKSHQKIG